MKSTTFGWLTQTVEASAGGLSCTHCTPPPPPPPAPPPASFPTWRGPVAKLALSLFDFLCRAPTPTTRTFSSQYTANGRARSVPYYPGQG